MDSVIKCLEAVKIVSDAGELFGEMGHPPDRDEVNKNSASHKITNITMDGVCVYGDVEFLADESPKEFRMSIRALSRGNNFEEIITWDIA